MKRYIAETKDQEYKFSVPENWDEVSFKDFLDFYQNKDDIEAVISVLTGLPVDFVSNPDYTELMIKIVEDINALGDIPNLKKQPKSLWTYEDKRVNLKLDSFKWTVSIAQQIDSVEIKSQLNEDSTDVEIFNIYADICAMFMQPHFDNSNYDYGESQKYKPYFMEQPFAEVVRLGTFFLTKQMRLKKNSTNHYLKTHTIMTKLKQVLKILVKPLVNIRAYILYRKAARLSEGKY